MSAASESGERANTELKRRDDRFLTVRVVLDVAIVCLGFWLGNTIMTVNSTLREHDKAITSIQTTIEVRTKSRDEQISDLRSTQNEAVVRLEKSVERLTDKVDRIAEKVGAK